MSKRILHIVETAYRATLEEQDDPVLWLAASLKGNGLAVDVILRGNAVNYLVAAQDASGLAFGERRQSQPPRLTRDVEALVAKGVTVYYVEDDARTRGLATKELVAAAKPIAQHAIPELLASYEQVWHW